MSLPAFTRGHLCLFFVFILVILSRKHTVRSFNGDLYPTIYDENDHIVILDELNFNKTIFCGNYNESCTAFVVEFYSGWCGHCRAYASVYKRLAKDIGLWSKFVKVAAINCADPFNQLTCTANDIIFYPLIKYFPRNSLDPSAAKLLPPRWSVAEMRKQIVDSLFDDFFANKYPDWPDFNFLPSMSTLTGIWSDIPMKTNILVLIFDESYNSSAGAQLMLDLWQYSDRIFVKRCLKDHNLAEANHIADFPSLVVFRRNETYPAFATDIRRLLFGSLEDFLLKEDEVDDRRKSPNNQTDIFCQANPQICRERFYVSERDLLKATRYAIFNEVTRSGKQLSGDNLTDLFKFYEVLAMHFPYETSVNGSKDTKEFMPLVKSEQVRMIFKHMSEYLKEKRNEIILMDDYAKEFLKAENESNNPFPIDDGWDHCAGSNSKFRGYTCALWITFHALTVSAYKNSLNESEFDPLQPLLAIRGWVNYFFGCRMCRDHFIRMTSMTFPVDGHVLRPEDMHIYLWKAHNIVNARLKGRETEDPKFPKNPFPPSFLCKTCAYKNGEYDLNEISKFLVEYYSAIKPFNG